MGWLQCCSTKFLDALPKTGSGTKTTALAFPAEMGEIKVLVLSRYNTEGLVGTNLFADTTGLAILLDNGGNPMGGVFAGILGGQTME